MTSETVVSARALASRRNGAKSRGPRTAAGKARSARNALKHGLRAQKLVLLDDEDAAAFQAFEAALHTELQPQGALQATLIARIALAAWRAQRADRIEAQLFARYLGTNACEPGWSDLGAGLIRDGHGPRAIDTLLRYRGSVLAELFRALGALKTLQAESTSDTVATLLSSLPRESKRTQAKEAASEGEPEPRESVVLGRPDGVQDVRRFRAITRVGRGLRAEDAGTVERGQKRLPVNATETDARRVAHAGRGATVYPDIL